MYDARQIANWFVRRAADDNNNQLSIMSLLKLTYIAHGWHLEMRKEPLFRNRIEAWQRGPVVPEVYSAFRGQGVHVSSEIAGYSSAAITPYDTGFLNEIYRIYGHLDPFTLSDLTHEQGGPWEIASKRGFYATMFDDEILKHYEQKRASSSA